MNTVVSAYRDQRWIPEGSEEVTRKDLSGVVYVQKSSSACIIAVGYKGRAKKPTFNILFRSEIDLKEYIDRFFDSIVFHEAEKLRRKEERKNMIITLRPGDVLCSSWGYDQTNVDFYQVIDVKNKRIIIREIAGNLEESGNMRGYTRPCRDAFIANPVVKTAISPNCVKIDSIRIASKFEGDKAYCSWYA